MPCHTHDRRTEIYLYFGLPDNERVIHLCGRPDRTRSMIVANQQAVISPPWSVHFGAGTAPYKFVWATGGENLAYDDMDPVANSELPMTQDLFSLDRPHCAGNRRRAKGIGAHCAAGLAAAGADIVLWGRTGSTLWPTPPTHAGHSGADVTTVVRDLADHDKPRSGAVGSRSRSRRSTSWSTTPAPSHVGRP